MAMAAAPEAADARYRGGPAVAMAMGYMAYMGGPVYGLYGVYGYMGYMGYMEGNACLVVCLKQWLLKLLQLCFCTSKRRAGGKDYGEHNACEATYNIHIIYTYLV